MSPVERVRSRVRRAPHVVRNTGWAAASEGSKVVTTLVIFVLITRVLGPGDYGVFAGVQAFVATLVLLSGQWVLMLLLQEVLREGRPLEEVLPRCLTMVVTGGLLATAAAMALGHVLFPDLALSTLLAFSASELLFGNISGIAASTVRTEADFGRATKIVLVGRVAKAVVVLGLVVTGAVSLGTLAWSFMTFNAVFAAACLWLASRFGVPVRLVRPSWPEVRSGLSYAATLVGFGVQEDSDKTLMVRLASATEGGIYAAGYRAVQLAMLPIRAVQQSSHLVFLQHDDSVKNLHVRRSVRYGLLAGAYGIAATAVLVLGADLIMKVLGGEYDEAADVVRWVAPLILLRALSTFPFNGLMGLRRNGVRVAIVVTTATLNLAANLVLIPIHGWRGAAMSTLATEAVFLVVTWVVLLRCQRRADRDFAAGAAPIGVTEPALVTTNA